MRRCSRYLRGVPSAWPLLVALIAIAAYVQVVFFNASLPAADGNSVDWGNYTKMTVASSLVWLVLIVGGVVLALRKPLAFKGAALSVCLVCVLAQAVSLTAVLLTPVRMVFVLWTNALW